MNRQIHRIKLNTQQGQRQRVRIVRFLRNFMGLRAFSTELAIRNLARRREFARAPVFGACTRANVRDLLGRFNDGLRFRVIADHNEVTVIRWHRLRRVRRADDRESLRGKRKC